MLNIATYSSKNTTASAAGRVPQAQAGTVPMLGLWVC